MPRVLAAVGTADGVRRENSPWPEHDRRKWTCQDEPTERRRLSATRGKRLAFSSEQIRRTTLSETDWHLGTMTNSLSPSCPFALATDAPSSERGSGRPEYARIERVEAPDVAPRRDEGTALVFSGRRDHVAIHEQEERAPKNRSVGRLPDYRAAGDVLSIRLELPIRCTSA